MGSQLTEFLHNKKINSQGPGVDWDGKKVAWVRSVENLFDYVKRILHDSIGSGDVLIDQHNMVLTEDFVGSYAIPALTLIVGSERVEFRPIGLAVLGAEGRVEICGLNGVITLLRDEKAGGEGWVAVLQRVPRRETKPLDAETLKFVLEKVMLPLP